MAAALISGGVGYHFLTKLYLNDPEAAAEYRQEADRLSLAAAIGKYTVKNLVFLFGVEYVRGRAADECGTRSLAAHVRALGVGVVPQLVTHGVMSRAELSTMAEQDVAAAPSMSRLWQTFDGHIPTLCADVDFPKAAMRGLLLQEFDWVDEAGQARAATGAPAAYSEPTDAFSAATRFAGWTTKHLGVTAAFWRAVLRGSPSGTTDDFSSLLKRGLLSLHGDGFIDVSWARSKFDRECSRRRWTLWDADDATDLRTLIAANFLDVSQVTTMFADALPRGAHGGHVAMAKEQHIVEFLRYWEPTLRRHPELIPQDVRYEVAAAKHEYDEATRRYDAACDAARVEEKQALAEADRRARAKAKPSSSKASEHKKQTPAVEVPKAEVDAIRSRREQRENSAQRDLDTAMQQIHSDFATRAWMSRPRRPQFEMGCSLQ